MSKKKVIQLTVVIGLAALTLPLTQGWAAEHLQMGSTKKAMTLEQLQAKHLPMITKALASARKAIGMGHKEHALMELKKVEDLITVLNKTLSQHVKPAFANTVCPIMGSKVPAKVPASLVREFKGQKVAFCCAGCPDQWDKLSNTQKQSKLMKAKPAKTMQHVH